jgi:hypothetical protein
MAKLSGSSQPSRECALSSQAATLALTPDRCDARGLQGETSVTSVTPCCELAVAQRAARSGPVRRPRAISQIPYRFQCAWDEGALGAGYSWPGAHRQIYFHRHVRPVSPSIPVFHIHPRVDAGRVSSLAICAATQASSASQPHRNSSPLSTHPSASSLYEYSPPTSKSSATSARPRDQIGLACNPRSRYSGYSRVLRSRASSILHSACDSTYSRASAAIHCPASSNRTAPRQRPPRRTSRRVHFTCPVHAPTAATEDRGCNSTASTGGVPLPRLPLLA